MRTLPNFSSGRNVSSVTAPVVNIAQLGAHDGRAATLLHVREVDDLEKVAVAFDGCARSQVGGGDHAVLQWSRDPRAASQSLHREDVAVEAQTRDHRHGRLGRE